jgi:lipopolysaccharide export system permease protein
MIIGRYIAREILKPTVAICTVIIFIFGCYIATRYLEDAVEGQLPGSTVILLILLRIVIALEVLLPTTLYLSVVIAFSRLYTDAEMTGMFACGISTARILKAVFLVAVTVGMIVACLSLYIRPWAWGQFFELKAKAKANFDMTRMKGGNFYEIENGKLVIFANNVDNSKGRAERVFIQVKKGDKLEIIYAEQAIQYLDHTTGNPIVLFQNGHVYEFPPFEKEGTVLKFEDFLMPLVPKDVIQPEYKLKAASTGHLMHSNNSEEIAAEVQWRLAAPLSTILLALLGLPLSRSSPRQGKYAGVPIAILIFAAYYNLSAMMKKWVGQGVVDIVPGIWWVHILLAGLLLVLLWRPHLLLRWLKS